MTYQQEQINPYHEGEKAQQVEAMFDNIAPTYDKLNHRLSWDIDKGWRKKAIRQLEPHKPQAILDIATGTGDFAILAAQMLNPMRLVGADISEGMMEVGRRKVERLGLQHVIAFEKEDCLALSYPDGTFDAVTAAFGIRNFADLDRTQRDVPRAAKRRTPEHRGADLSRDLPHEATVPALLTYGAAPLRAADIKGRKCLLLPDENHRSLSARRKDGGHSDQGRLQRSEVQKTYLRHLHHVFCN